MAVSINTSDYIKTKNVEIDGEKFIFQPMTTSKYLAYLEMQGDLKNLTAKKPEEVGEALEKVLDTLFSLFDKPARVKELLGEVPPDQIEKLVSKLMGDGND